MQSETQNRVVVRASRNQKPVLAGVEEREEACLDALMPLLRFPLVKRTNKAVISRVGQNLSERFEHRERQVAGSGLGRVKTVRCVASGRCSRLRQDARMSCVELLGRTDAVVEQRQEQQR